MKETWVNRWHRRLEECVLYTREKRPNFSLQNFSHKLVWKNRNAVKIFTYR